MKRNKKVHPFYYVYRLEVGNKFYYGISNDIEKRKKDHHYSIKKVFNGDVTSHTPLKIHHEAAAYYKKNYPSSEFGMVKYLTISICFKSDKKEIADAVESFLIIMAQFDKNCCNVHPGKNSLL